MAHGIGVARVIEHVTVVETDPIEGVHRTEIDVVREALATELPELLEEKRRRDDGRACIEDEALVAEDAGAPSGLVETIDDSDAITATEQTNGGGEPTEAGADHDHPGRALIEGYGRSGGLQRALWVDIDSGPYPEDGRYP
jgi:hypothetical protein